MKPERLAEIRALVLDPHHRMWALSSLTVKLPGYWPNLAVEREGTTNLPYTVLCRIMRFSPSPDDADSRKAFSADMDATIELVNALNARESLIRELIAALEAAQECVGVRCLGRRQPGCPLPPAELIVLDALRTLYQEYETIGDEVFLLTPLVRLHDAMKRAGYA